MVKSIECLVFKQDLASLSIPRLKLNQVYLNQINVHCGLTEQYAISMSLDSYLSCSSEIFINPMFVGIDDKE